MDPAVAAQLEQLKKKWAPQAAANAAAARLNGGVPSVGALEAAEAKHTAHADGTSRDTHHEDRLSGLIICRECQGAGTIHEEYNHMVISKTCRMCDGDGIRPRPGHTASADVSAATVSRAVKRALGEDDDDELDIPDDLPPLETA